MNHATQIEEGAVPPAGRRISKLLFPALLGLGVLGGSVFVEQQKRFAPEAAVAVEQALSEHAAVAPVATLTPAEVVDEGGLSAEMARVRDWIARRYRVSTVALEPVLEAAEEAGRLAGIDPLLIVAVMAIESSFNPFAESQMGARGLMQVIPRFHKDKIGPEHDENALFDPALNVRVGTQVLHEGLRRYGSMQAALQYYGGALSDPQASYARKVMAMKKRLVSAAGRRSATDA